MNGNDGYIQTKQRELNDKLIATDRNINTINAKIDVIEKKIGDYNKVIDLLKEQDKFHDLLKRENERNLEKFIADARVDIDKQIKRMIGSNVERLFNIIKDVKIIIKGYRKETENLKDDLARYLMTFSNFVLLLAKKNLITTDEAEDIFSEALRINKELKKRFLKHQDKLDRIFAKMGLDKEML